jgi:hypothetical protein
MSGNKEYVDGNEGVVMVVEEAAGSGTDVMWFEPSVVLKDVKSSVWSFFKFKGTLVKGPNKAKKRRLSMTGDNVNIQLFLRDNLDI